ncbi:MAG: hypothetical protein IJH32_08765 [Ruminococcus sp.]|nr:hypothetical protein [Ruminococcus sp.]
MERLPYEINEKYSCEWNRISEKIRQLEEGRIKELSGLDYDGYLSTNIQQLKKMLADLLDKIQNGKDSIIH